MGDGTSPSMSGDDKDAVDDGDEKDAIDDAMTDSASARFSRSTLNLLTL